MYESQQKQVIDSLKTSSTSRVWLIVGLRGVGKKQFAENVIFQLTHSRSEYSPFIKWIRCGLTETSKKEIQKSILAGSSPEEKEWARKTEITIEDIQEATRFLSLKSETLKILVFDLADEMNENAQNALLKTLEEPSSGTLILLLCENSGHLLPTILSRCQKIQLHPPNKNDFNNMLKQKYPALTSVQIDEISFLSDHIFGAAETILQSDGLLLYHKLLNFLDTSLKLDTLALIDFCEKVAQEKSLFDIVTKALLKQINSLAKEVTIASLSKARTLSELYTTIKHQIEEIDSKNLDKKQNLISMIIQTREVL